MLKNQEKNPSCYKLNNIPEKKEMITPENIENNESKAMNFPGSNLYVTYTIIAINIIIFILMIVNGAGIFEPNGMVHIKWGSNFTPLTLTGDWWRLVTSVFIHFGIIHIVMNMYCLYAVGVYLEPMLGKTRYITAYLSTGVLASIVSLWWHKEGVNSAGASGAIFGLYGLFLALLTTKLIPEKVRKAQLQSIGIFVVYNLVYGMKGGVDNAAHIGGLISGFIVGYLYAISIKKERQEQKAAWVLPLIVIATIGIAALYLNDNKRSEADRNAVLSKVRSRTSGYEDEKIFELMFNEIVDLQNQAKKIYEENLPDELLQKKLTEECLPLWDKAASIARQLKGMDISPEMDKKADAVTEYINLRKREIEIITDIVINKSPIGTLQLDSVRNKVNEIFERLK